MAEEQIYTCVCGKTYTNIQAFRGHKSHCKEHLTQTGRLHIREEVDSKNGEKSGKKLKEKARQRKEQELKQWIAEQHKCECCGKIMTKKYATGRFCSKQCANSRPQTEETKQKIKKAINEYVEEHPECRERSRLIGLKYFQEHPEERYRLCKSQHNFSKEEIEEIENEYLEKPNLCVICNAILPYKQRNKKTCSNGCYRKLISKNVSNAAKRAGGNLNSCGVRGTAKYGTYKGIHCDSSWELAFVIYCLEHNTTIDRNTDGFPYIYDNETHLYFPDFIINNEYIEVKNYNTDVVQAKINQFPKDKVLKVLFKPDMKKYIKYCVDKYGKHYTTMYDKDKPSWMDKNKNDMTENNS